MTGDGSSIGRLTRAIRSDAGAGYEYSSTLISKEYSQAAGCQICQTCNKNESLHKAYVTGRCMFGKQPFRHSQESDRIRRGIHQLYDNKNFLVLGF